MFEYLMPQLVMPAFEGTLLDQTCRAAVERQRIYGRSRGLPWGISESCYHLTDGHGTYQYRAFGVPGLGMQRGLADDLVVAPCSWIRPAPAPTCGGWSWKAASGSSATTRASTTRPPACGTENGSPSSGPSWPIITA